MHLSSESELVLLTLLVAVAAMVVAAPRLRIPYPILLVLGGLALGFLPGMPNLELPPDLVLVAVLPPLLYAGTFFTSLHELKLNLRPIGLLAVGLVITTTVAVAVVAHELIDDLPWASAFVLGAIVSPTDPVAATAIAHRFGVPRRLVAIVEGESLINDGTALVAYRFAVAAVVTGAFSIWDAGLEFVVDVAGGILVGLAVGWVIRQVRRRLNNPPIEITLALLSGYLAYLPAELLHVSAVLAAVTVGIYMGSHTSELTTAQTRVQGDAVWEIVVFVLNALLFVLVGLQLPVILDELSGQPAGTLLGYGAAVSATVILVRIAWVYPATYLPRRLSRRIRERDPSPPWQYPAFISWTGMRGAVSLAAALAVPMATDTGAPFPGRDLILFLSFSVILVTLVGQGLTMPLVIRWLGLEVDERVAHEEAKARIKAAEAALARLEQLTAEDWVRDDTAERIRGLYTFRRNRFAARFDDGDDGALEERSVAYQRLVRELLDAERETLEALRREGRISSEVAQRVVRDLDLEDLRLDA
ncbi:MAG TPA: Na+/H+ antiporter [Gaiellaceae bacterium]|nr:Na+/H+ antiporter [Gaiellaceae bacterium]